MRDVHWQNQPNQPQPLEHIVYSDGMAVISVFVDNVAPGRTTPVQGFSVSGAMSTFTTENHQHQVTVVGEVPPLTVRQIATSMTPADGTQASE